MVTCVDCIQNVKKSIRTRLTQSKRQHELNRVRFIQKFTNLVTNSHNFSYYEKNTFMLLFFKILLMNIVNVKFHELAREAIMA